MQVKHAQAAVFHLDHALLLKGGQGFIHPLARQADEIGEFLLRDAQHLADAVEDLDQARIEAAIVTHGAEHGAAHPG